MSPPGWSDSETSVHGCQGKIIEPSLVEHDDGTDVKDGVIQALSKRLERFREECQAIREETENRFQDLGNRLEAAESDLEGLKKTRSAIEQVVWEWETCGRIAQGINDYLRRKVLESVESDLDEVKVIWECPDLRKSRLRYLPHLFTVWWIQWNMENPIAYPLPAAFQPISDSERQYYQLIPTLPNNVNHAAETLWNSKHRPLLILMLTMHLSRPKPRNSIQHPTPPIIFAKTFVRSSTQLSRHGIEIAMHVIESGHKMQDGQCEFLFDHESSDPWERGNLDRYLDEELECGLGERDLLAAPEEIEKRPRQTEEKGEDGIEAVLKRRKYE